MQALTHPGLNKTCCYSSRAHVVGALQRPAVAATGIQTQYILCFSSPGIATGTLVIEWLGRWPVGWWPRWMVCSLTNRMTLINGLLVDQSDDDLDEWFFVDRSDDNTDFMFAHWPIRRWLWWMVCLLTNQMMALMNRLLVDQSDDDTDEWFAPWPIRWWHWRMGCSMTKRSGDDSRECLILGQTNDCPREYFTAWPIRRWSPWMFLSLTVWGIIEQI